MIAKVKETGEIVEVNKLYSFPGGLKFMDLTHQKAKFYNYNDLDFNIQQKSGKPVDPAPKIPDGLVFRLTVERYRTISKQDRMLKYELLNALDQAIVSRDISINCILKIVEEKCKNVKELYPNGSDFLVENNGGKYILVSNKNARIFKKVCRIDLHVSVYIVPKEEQL